MPKTVLLNSGYRIGLQFTVVIDFITGEKPSQTALTKHLSILKLKPDTVLFRNPLDTDSAFTLRFSDIEPAFNLTASMLYSGQEFNTEILSMNSKNVDLHLVEKLSLGLTQTALQANL